MQDFDAILDRMTRRLKIDPELQLEVRQELATHLEASAAEFRAAGESPEQAVASAIRAMGEPDALADDLWQANRKRVRVRYWAKWIARMALVPALVLAVFALMVPAMLSQSQMAMFNSGGYGAAGHNWYQQRLIEQLSPEARLIIFGDTTADDPVAQQRAIHERFPDEPIYYANYIAQLVSDHAWIDPDTDVVDEQRLAFMLNELERGSQLEPANGYYDMLRASLLLRASAGELVDREELAYQVPGHDGGMRETVPQGVVVKDAQQFEAGLDALREAVSRPYITSHSLAMEQHRQSLLPEPWRLADMVHRQGRAVSVLLPELGHSRRTARLSAAHALNLAMAGDTQSADALLDDVEQLASLTAADSDALIQLLVAQSIQQLALDYDWLVHKQAGHEAQAAAAWEQATASREFYYSLRHERDDQASMQLHQRGGLVLNMLTPGIGEIQINTQAPREAELAMLDQGVVGMLLFLLTACVILWSFWIGVMLFKRRGRDDAPVLLWIGWRRLGLVLLASVVGPLLVFAVWTWGLPNGSRSYGINFAGDRIAVEYALLVIVMAVTGWHMSAWALRQRARELGMDVPSGRSRAAWIAIAAFTLPMAVALMIYFIIWPHGTWLFTSVMLVALLVWALLWLSWAVVGLKQRTPDRHSLRRAVIGVLVVLPVLGVTISFVMGRNDQQFWLTLGGLILLLSIVVIGGIVLVKTPSRHPRFTASAARSMVPVLAVAGLLLAVSAGPALQVLEAVRVRQMVNDGLFIWTEVDRSSYRRLRDRLAQMEPSAAVDGER